MEIPKHNNAAFILAGLVGVLLKHGLQAAFVSELEDPFHQFPANMVGSFLVGLFTNMSTPAAAAVGSVTSFAPWIQAIASTFLAGQWLFALCSLVTGLELSYMSFKVGLDVAEMLGFPPDSKENQQQQQQQGTCCVLSLSTCLWLLVVLLAVLDDTVRRPLWLACIVAPQGVWLRCLLSTNFNSSRCSLPLGTWTSNIIASALQAGLIFVKVTDPATGIALDALHKGFIDSVGTVSTLVAEAHALHRNDDKGWRAYSYTLSTMVTCLLVATIISATSTTSSPLVPVLKQQSR